MSASNVNAMVKEAIRLLKAGNKAEARTLLERATELDSYNEQAWLWLSGVVETDEDQRTCLSNVLFINPSNQHAKQGIAMLDAKIAAKTPDRSVVAPEESPFSGFDLPSGDSLMDELESMRQSSTTDSQLFPQVSPFTDSNFEDFDDDDSGFIDPSIEDPFTVNTEAPFTTAAYKPDAADELGALVTEQRRSALESEAESLFSGVPELKPQSAPKRRTAEVRQPAPPPEDGEMAALFRLIPKEIKPGRMPGTDAATPPLYIVVTAAMVVVTVSMAVVTFGKLFAPLG
jgi:hypothetical protein